jgi:hypothetical protein
LSGFIPLLPFIEQKPMYDQIAAGDPTIPSCRRGRPLERMAAGGRQYRLERPPDALLCPSDNGYSTKVGRINSYAFSNGDRSRARRAVLLAASRTVWAERERYNMSHITDGTITPAAFRARQSLAPAACRNQDLRM